MTDVYPAAPGLTSANPGPALYALIETAMLADGWQFVDTVVDGTVTHKVLRSPGSLNSLGVDWYLDINFPTTGSTGGMRFAPFEFFDATSDLGYRGPVGHVSSTTIDGTTYSRYGAAGSALSTNWQNTSGQLVGISLSTSNFRPYISITMDRVTACSPASPSNVVYAGVYEPTEDAAAHADTAAFPLIMCLLTPGTDSGSNTAAGTSRAALTRAPKASTINWSTSVLVGCNTAGMLQATGRVGTADSEYTDLRSLAPIPIIAGVSSLSTSSPTAARVGQLKDVRVGFVASTAVRFDYATVDGDEWFVCTPVNSWTVFVKGSGNITPDGTNLGSASLVGVEASVPAPEAVTEGLIYPRGDGWNTIGGGEDVDIDDLLRTAGIPRGKTGVVYRFVAACLRYVNSTTWEILTDSGHAATGVSGVSIVSSDRLRLSYDFTATKVVTSAVTPDETYSAGGVRAGASVGLTYADISIYLGGSTTPANPGDSALNNASANLWVYALFEVAS